MPASSAKHVAIIGAGPGGLTCAMILAHRGFRVTVLEREAQVGGRNAAIRLGPYTFDTGPTFLMLKDILDQVFHESGANSESLLEFKRLDPMYRLHFRDRHMDMSSDPAVMKSELTRCFPGSESAFERFFAREQRRFTFMLPCLQKSYHKASALVSREMRRALPHLALTRKLYDVMNGYFGDPELSLAFTFQSKYLGMSPWECPGVFAMIPYIEHAFGIYHTTGGLSRISDVMADVARRNGAEIRLNATVRRILAPNRVAEGVELESGEVIRADAVVINADFGHAMTTLFEPGLLRKYSPARVARKEYSCSTYMLYLGLDTCYTDSPHHAIAFAPEYRRQIDSITAGRMPDGSPSFYVRNASLTDPTLAPAGHSAVYVLVPAPNNRGSTDWSRTAPELRERVLDAIETRTPMKDIRRHIVMEKAITPADWQTDHHVYLGATFNLSHCISQMVYFRPRNRFEEVDRCYLVGGGTHPGSGLPTIYESGRIVANLLCRSQGVPFVSGNLVV